MEITEIVRSFKELALIRSNLFYRSTEVNHQFALKWFVDDMMQIFDTITISPEDLAYIKTKLLQSLNEVQEQNQSWKQSLKESKENSQYVRDCNGREFWYEFDCNKNITYHKDSHPQGEEYWQEYDVNNNRIFYRNSYGFEKRCEYDANNNLIHSKNSDGFEKWYEYDSHNNLVCWRNSDGEEGHNHIEYYDDGQLKKLNELEIPWFEKEVM